MRAALPPTLAFAIVIACGGRTTSTTDSDEPSRGVVVGSNGATADADASRDNDSGGDAGPTGTGAPASPCKDGSDCASGVCFVGGNRSFCTFRCTPTNAAIVCAGPFGGQCNQMGYCRLGGGP